MKKDSRNKAFTLIEMLVVVIIIGIILAIALSSVSSIVHNRSEKLYKVHMDIVETAMSNYVDRHRGQLLNSDKSCFIINYNTLISDGFVKESDIKCNGSIIISKIANSNSFTTEYYLTCIDQNDDVVKTSDNVPNSCAIFN